MYLFSTRFSRNQGRYSNNKMVTSNKSWVPCFHSDGELVRKVSKIRLPLVGTLTIILLKPMLTHKLPDV